MKVESIYPIKINSLGISKYNNKLKSNENSDVPNSKIISYPKNYYLSSISFLGKGVPARQLIKNIGEENFPNYEIVERLAQIEGNSDYSLYDIHLDHYNELLECTTLDEAKELYPEFSDVKDAKDIDLSTLGNRNILHKIAKGEIEGIDIGNLSLELLKRYYGELKSTKLKEEYWGIVAVPNLLKTLNIKILDKNYAATANKQSAAFRKKQSEATIEQMKDPKQREMQRIKQKELWENPDFVFNTDAYIEALRAAARRNRQNPGSKYNTKEYSERMAKIMRERWADPKDVFNTPEHRKRKSDIMKDLWQDPVSVFNTEDYRKKLSAAMKKQWEDPFFREFMKQTMLDRWKDPDYRQYMELVYEARVRAWDMHPEIRTVVRDTAKEFPGLRKALNRTKRTNDDERLVNAYYKKCEANCPGYMQKIGDEQHRILVDWGVVDP